MVSSPRSPHLPRNAIKKTLRYADFFRYDLTKSELHFWLISPKIYSPQTVQQFNRLTDQLSRRRLQRLKISQNKFQLAKKAASFLKFFPTIQLVAATGSLSMNNAKPSDDIDLMVITTANTLWLTRLFIIPLTRLFFKSRLPSKIYDLRSKIYSDAICLNLWLDTQALAVLKTKRSLYTAHEVLQIKPLINKNHTYEKFILSNSWTKNYLANAYRLITSKFPAPAKGRGDPASAGWVGFLNLLAFRLQYFYMKSKITTETVSLHSAYFHPRSLASQLDRLLQITP